MLVEAIENVYIDYSRNCVEGKIYEVKDISKDGSKYLIRDDEGSELYINKYHFKIVVSTKIYLVKDNYGDCENCRSDIIAAFFDEQKATEAKNTYNKLLAAKDEQYHICKKCPVQNMSIEDQESQEKFIQTMKKKCSLADITFYDDGYISCEGEPDPFTEDNYDATIEIIEVE